MAFPAEFISDKVATPGGVLGKILVGVSYWDCETLTLHQTTFRSLLQPYSRLDAKNPYPIPD